MSDERGWGSEEELKDILFQLSMQKKWDEIAELYEKEPAAAGVILTKSWDTALHVAVSSNNAKGANHIKTMISFTPSDLLGMRNELGNTPLHLAAAVGWQEMCFLIASKNPQLIYVRNIQKQTPLYVAAHHGNLESFRCLHQKHDEERRRDEEGQRQRLDIASICRGEHGNTILHSAISSDNFELALEIIHCYEELMTLVNEKGESPLFVLASKPSVFDSTAHYDSFFYRCLFVEKLEEGDREKKKLGKWDLIFLDEENQHQRRPASSVPHRKGRSIAACYAICILPLQLAYKAILIAVGFGISEIREIQRKQEQHSLAIKVMNKLIEYESLYKYYGDSDGGRPSFNQYRNLYAREFYDILNEYSSPPSLTSDCDAPPAVQPKLERTYSVPLLKAAERGILAMVEKILTTFPVAIHDVNPNGKNVLMVAAENRHARVFDYLITLNLPSYMFHQVDDEGNNILHLAANKLQLDSWRILGATRLMQWEYNWYQHVKGAIPLLCASQENMQGKTPWQVFSATHGDLVKESAHWHIKTSESYSVVAALVATVAFATSATVPGGLNQNTGYPIMLAHKEFDIFSVSSLLALCLSVTALLFFLAIMSSPEYHFKSTLPRKLLIGLSCLFGSIVAMLVSFFAGHSFVLGEKLGRAALPIYTTACAAVTIFAIANLPLFFAVKINLRSLPS